jgi:uncharacterized Zn-binding protein involved in type VI secretion
MRIPRVVSSLWAWCRLCSRVQLCVCAACAFGDLCASWPVVGEGADAREVKHVTGRARSRRWRCGRRAPSSECSVSGAAGDVVAGSAAARHGLRRPCGASVPPSSPSHPTTLFILVIRSCSSSLDHVHHHHHQIMFIRSSSSFWSSSSSSSSDHVRRHHDHHHERHYRRTIGTLIAMGAGAVDRDDPAAHEQQILCRCRSAATSAEPAADARAARDDAEQLLASAKGVVVGVRRHECERAARLSVHPGVWEQRWVVAHLGTMGVVKDLGDHPVPQS